MSEVAVLTKVTRFDSMPLNATYFTAEGYLIDHPILTTCGIFEYTNKDGSTRKELRLPEEVFKRESLESYKGKPIIITHNAGVVDKNNVAEEQIGTILGNGYKDGKDVRAEIIIHNTEELKSSGLRALSLGYNLELDETPGEWHGQHYDAIQRNIEINHLALVAEARAGDSARLNIDGKDKKTIGGETMKKRRNADGEAMDPVVLEEAINAFKARKEQETEKKDAAKKKMGFFRRKKDGDFKPMDDKAKSVPEEVVEEKSFEERVDSVKKRRDKRDEQDEPSDARAALGVIAEQDEDIDELLKIIEEMGAKNAENKDEDDVDEETVDEVEFEEDEDEEEDEEVFEDEIEDEEPDDEEDEDEDEEEVEESEEEFDEDEDDDFEEEEDFEDEEEIERKDKKRCDNDRSLSKNLNLDSVDKYIARKIDVCRTGDLLNLRGLEKMKLMDARKAVVKRMNPGIRLDGKSDSYINGLYQSARNQAMKARRTDAQRKAIFNNDGVELTNKTGAELARERMIKNMKGEN